MKESRNKKNAVGETTIAGIEFGQLEKLLSFMALHDLEEFEYERGGLRIRLKKALGITTARPVSGAPPASIPVQAAVEPAHTVPSPAMPASSAADTNELHIIKSPIVGTFYAASGPGAASFVKIGDMIQAGQVVCIIEAMKLMNEIEADVSGEVVRVLVENSQPVEYGQGLFAIRPAKKK
jgi:acetyl-CoA carboxylase biotin carboxyl carrier protein